MTQTSLPRARARATATALVTLLAVGATSLSPPGSEAAEAHTTTTVTSTERVAIGGRVESAPALDLTINDGTASRYPSSTNGPTGLAGNVTDVNVTIQGFSHERPRDVDILLQAPNGQTVVLMSDVGGTAPVSGLTLTFDDQAGAEVDPAGVPQSGTWKPSNEDADDQFPAPAPAVAPGASLSTLNGQRANGTWSVYVVDDTFDYFGSIAGFVIEVESSGPSLYPSTITTSGLPATVTDVNVSLSGLRHVWAADVDILLVGPQGQQATILSDAGVFATGVQTVNLTLDDEAPTGLPERTVSGTFRPQNNQGPDVFPAPAPTASGDSSLSVFDGTNPNGVWSLYVVDDRETDDGSLNGWSLTIAAKGPVQDTTGPRVRKHRPGAGATRVDRAANVVVMLDEAARPKTVSAATAYVVRKGTTRRVPAVVTWESDTRRIVVDPNRSLRPHTTYRVVVTTKVADLAGNRLDQDATRAGLQRSSWKFTTR